MVRLGPSAFSSISGENVKAALLIGALHVVRDCFYGIDAEFSPGSEKANRLRLGELLPLSRESIGQHTDRALRLVDWSGRARVGDFCTAYKGLTTGDDPWLKRYFWELPKAPNDKWAPLRTGDKTERAFGGMQTTLRRDLSPGSLPWSYAERSTEPLGKLGIALSHVGDVSAGFYLGELHDQSVASVIPGDPLNLLPLYCFLSSPRYAKALLRVDSSIKVTEGNLLKVPFEIDEWRQVAAQEYPEGLPEPWSDDPTQWLFESRPEVATEPLQVGMGRLLAYRWPQQPEQCDLDELADEDGIVCLPAVAGELPAADRLQALLARAYGKGWSPGRIQQLLEQAGSKKKNLADWIRDEFFKHHCKVFLSRPFAWHIWDGRKDGFSALVNYHLLDRAGLERLTYTYLGDWIERQRADAVEEVVGADLRLAAARVLKGKLEAILEGEPPYDLYLRWKELHEQPLGWEPDLDDGVRLNMRPFVEAGVLRAKVNVHWRKDRGKNRDGSERHNDLHYSLAEKREARDKAQLA
jgi:hypothetical protein